MQRDNVLALVVDPFDNVNFPDWVFVKVVRPAATDVSLSARPKHPMMRNSQGWPNTTSRTRHVLNVGNQKAIAISCLGLQTDTVSAMSSLA